MKMSFRRPNWLTRGTALCGIAVLSLAMSCPCLPGGSIFDDDWTPPPASAKPENNPPSTVRPDASPPPAGQNPKTDSAAPNVPATHSDEPAAPRTRLPIPSRAEQAKSRTVFKELYAKELTDKSVIARRALAGKLLKQADSVKDVPTDEFVLLIGAAKAGTEGSDLPASCKAVDALVETFELDGLRYKADLAVKTALRDKVPEQTAKNCNAGLELVDQLLAAGDELTAERLLQALRAAAPGGETGKEIRSREEGISSRKIAAERAAPFQKKLSESPDDPEANLVVGKYLCFVKSDWAHGLSMLVKSGNAVLVKAASLEVAANGDAARQAEIGDAWWDVSEAESGPDKPAIEQHAAECYSAALRSGNVAGLKRTLVEKRIATAVATGSSASKHRVIDLIAQVDPSKDTVEGGWTKKDGHLFSDASDMAKIQFPYHPPVEYDFTIEFVRTTGDGDVDQVLVKNGHAMRWAVGSPGTELEFAL